jgi:hypothetical protein
MGDEVRQAMPLHTSATDWVDWMRMKHDQGLGADFFAQVTKSGLSEVKVGVFRRHRSWIVRNVPDVTDLLSWLRVCGVTTDAWIEEWITQWATRGVMLHASVVSLTTWTHVGPSPLPLDVMIQLPTTTIRNEISSGRHFRQLQVDFCSTLSVPSPECAQHLDVDEYNQGVREFLSGLRVPLRAT